MYCFVNIRVFLANNPAFRAVVFALDTVEFQISQRSKAFVALENMRKQRRFLFGWAT